VVTLRSSALSCICRAGLPTMQGGMVMP
jgi:hypothetical protein